MNPYMCFLSAGVLSLCLWGVVRAENEHDAASDKFRRLPDTYRPTVLLPVRTRVPLQNGDSVFVGAQLIVAVTQAAPAEDVSGVFIPLANEQAHLWALKLPSVQDAFKEESYTDVRNRLSSLSAEFASVVRAAVIVRPAQPKSHTPVSPADAFLSDVNTLNALVSAGSVIAEAKDEQTKQLIQGLYRNYLSRWKDPFEEDGL